MTTNTTITAKSTPAGAAKYKLIISDCHLSAGRFFEGHLNPHEDFYFDDEMVELFRYFSQTPDYADSEVELFINGDFFDFLNVPYHGEFEDVITEEMALYKLEAIMSAHSAVMAAIRAFASLPGKTVTYMIGNHDADLFFPKVRERIKREWDAGANAQSEKVQIIADRDRVKWEGGVEIHHGNQFEAVHFLDFDQPLIESYGSAPVLNIPWAAFTF